MIRMHKNLIPYNVMSKITQRVYNQQELFFSNYIVNFDLGKILIDKIDGIGKLTFHMSQGCPYIFVRCICVNVKNVRPNLGP